MAITLTYFHRIKIQQYFTKSDAYYIYAKGTSADKFKADLGQLLLLSQREHITSTELPICLFNNPDMLSDALLSSVGSYGVFYNNGQIVEMAYYPACQIHLCRLIGASVVRMAKYNTHNFEKIITTNGYDENQGTHKISDFGDALVNMQIGAPIEIDTIAYFTPTKN